MVCVCVWGGAERKVEISREREIQRENSLRLSQSGCQSPNLHPTEQC